MGGTLDEQRAITVDGTRRVVSAMRSAGAGRLVALSTFALYDYLAIPDGSLLSETSPLSNPGSGGPYERAKREQEDLVRASALSWTILRPGIVFGRNRTWSYHIGWRGLRRWVCYAGDSTLPLSYVENCAEAVAACLSGPASERAILNVVDTELPTRRGWAEALARRHSPRPRVGDVSWKTLTRLAGFASWIDRRLLFGRAPLPDLLRPASLHARCKPLRYTNERARAVLGWNPRHDLGAALERSFAD
jgi:nucleoside-diphosphate-sugar epimerase